HEVLEPADRSRDHRPRALHRLEGDHAEALSERGDDDGERVLDRLLDRRHVTEEAHRVEQVELAGEILEAVLEHATAGDVEARVNGTPAGGPAVWPYASAWTRCVCRIVGRCCAREASTRANVSGSTSARIGIASTGTPLPSSARANSHAPGSCSCSIRKRMSQPRSRRSGSSDSRCASEPEMPATFCEWSTITASRPPAPHPPSA